jgi:F0F1-type ATP synthase assembly protein I
MMRLPIPRRVDADDTVVQGMEAMFTIALFLGLGYLVDRWLDSRPVFMIVLFLIGAIGVFARFKYGYDARMERLEAERRAGSAGRRDDSPTEVA